MAGGKEGRGIADLPKGCYLTNEGVEAPRAREMREGDRGEEVRWWRKAIRLQVVGEGHHSSEAWFRIRHTGTWWAHMQRFLRASYGRADFHNGRGVKLGRG